MDPVFASVTLRQDGARSAGPLVASALAPGQLDRYRARIGFSSLKTHPPEESDQLANLWEPADCVGGDDFGAHGHFDDRTAPRSRRLWAVAHHGLPDGTAALVAGVGATFQGRC